MWFKLGKNYRSSIKNQLAQSDSSLNVDQKMANHSFYIESFNYLKVKDAKEFPGLKDTRITMVALIKGKSFSSKNSKRTMMIRCILTELLESKSHEKCSCLNMSILFRNFELQ